MKQWSIISVMRNRQTGRFFNKIISIVMRDAAGRCGSEIGDASNEKQVHDI